MYPYHKALSKRIEKLSNLVNDKYTAVQNAPEGTLHISTSKNSKRVQYYLYKNNRSHRTSYIPTENKQLINALAQKDYDLKVLNLARKELSLLIRIQKQSVSFFCAEEVYSHLSFHRRQLVTPVELSDEDYIQQWKSQQFAPKLFDEHTPEHYTSRGERVRSKSEVLIADTLDEMGIPYLYEKPIILKGRIIHPDFTILHIPTRRTLFLEHFGMMDDPDYANMAVAKTHLYISSDILPGDRLILTFESKNHPLNTKLLKAQLRGLS